MHEVDRGTGGAERLQQRVVPGPAGLRLDQAIPADMRHALRHACCGDVGYHTHVALQDAEAWRLAEFLAGLEQDLHADANAEHWPPEPDELTYGIAMAKIVHGAHAFGERADAGHDQPLGGHRGVRVFRHM